MAAATVQGEQLNKMLQCSICIDVFTDPRTLPCQHTFCVKCIADWCKDKQRGGKATCPECREKFVIPDSGIDGIKKNFFIANLLSMHEVKQKTGDLCEICVGDDKNVSEMFCLQCEQSYCESCSKSHSKIKMCTSHKLVRLEELQSGIDITKKDQPVFSSVKSGVFKESGYKSGTSASWLMNTLVGALPIKKRQLISRSPGGATNNNPQLLFTLNQPPTYSNGCPRQVIGVAMLDKYLCVVYKDYNQVQVFNCKSRFKKCKDIQINGMRWPFDMVGCSMTSRLFVIDCASGNIWRVNVTTGVSDVFIKLGCECARLSLVENRLLVTSCDSMLMYDIHSGRRMKNIPLTGDMKKYTIEHAIESNRDSFFVCHGEWESASVSEIDSEGRVIRVFDNKQQLNCIYMALDSVGHLLVADLNNFSIVLLNEHLQFIKFLLDRERLDDAWPHKLNYNKKNNRLTVGLCNGHVKIFDCHV